jgi:dolichyl-phosphate-mannose--protein O-mannosyl transferase
VKRDARAGLLLVAVLAQWLPWFLIASRVQFFFYMTPITPFMVLAMTYSLKDLSEVQLAGSKARAFLPAAVLIIVASVAVFAFFWPILIGSPLSHNAWMARMWRSSWI